MKDIKFNKFKKLQSIDEIDIGIYKVYNILLENYVFGSEYLGSYERLDKMLGSEYGMFSMFRSQLVLMLDDEMFIYGGSKGS